MVRTGGYAVVLAAANFIFEHYNILISSNKIQVLNHYTCNKGTGFWWAQIPKFLHVKIVYNLKIVGVALAIN